MLRRESRFQRILLDVPNRAQNFIIVVQVNFPAAFDPRSRHAIICRIRVTFKGGRQSVRTLTNV